MFSLEGESRRFGAILCCLATFFNFVGSCTEVDFLPSRCSTSWVRARLGCAASTSRPLEKQRMKSKFWTSLPLITDCSTVCGSAHQYGRRAHWNAATLEVRSCVRKSLCVYIVCTRGWRRERGHVRIHRAVDRSVAVVASIPVYCSTWHSVFVRLHAVNRSSFVHMYSYIPCTSRSYSRCVAYSSSPSIALVSKVYVAWTVRQLVDTANDKTVPVCTKHLVPT